MFSTHFSHFYASAHEHLAKIRFAPDFSGGDEDTDSARSLGMVCIAKGTPESFEAIIVSPLGNCYQGLQQFSLSDNVEFWRFAANNYFWITAGSGLRSDLELHLDLPEKKVKGRGIRQKELDAVGGQADALIIAAADYMANVLGKN